MESVLSTFAEYTIEPIGRLLGRQVGYVIHCKINLQKLEDQVEELEVAREVTENQVAEAERKGERIQPDVQLWLTKVGEITAHADELLNDESQAKLKCLHGFCPNLTVRHQLSRKSTKLVEEVVEHCAKRGLISQVSTNRDYVAFQSRTSIVKEILDGLKDSKIERMGVYGMGGVGKTTLVKEVYKQASEDKKLFDDVIILLDVKRNPGLEAIQKKIVDKLGMEILQNETIEGRASRLCATIQDKKILVILDDVEEKIDLEAVGLPRLPTCKILLTFRTRQVFDEMCVDKVFRLDLLDKQETWILFVKMAGDVINQNGGIRDVAIKVAESCGGLPLLVVTFASALKQKNKLHAWKDALRRLKGFDKEELTEKAYLALEWSYHQLDDKEFQPLFLLCGVMVKQNHIYVQDLLKYGMGLGLFKNVNTVEEARDALDSLLEKLKDSCLLLDSDVDGKVRMHDLVCHVAKRIAYRDQHVLSVEYGGEWKEWPDKYFLRKCTMISLPRVNIPTLSEIPLECPELELFFWRCKYGYSVEIPSNFFREMQKLKVLDLSSMSMPSLPLSLESLKNLRTLCLDDCTLGDITLIGQLSNLEILSFLQSEIKELPKEIGQLTRLRLLDLSNCYQLEVISPTVISSLVRLEDLRMRNSFNKWEVEGEGSNASLSELKHLFQLSALEIHIPNTDVLPANLFSHKLERFNIFIGDAWVRYSSEVKAAMTLNTLKLKLTKSIKELDEGLKLLLKRSEDLSLDETEVVIINQLNTEDTEHWKHLQLKNSFGFTDIINRKAMFPNLSSLVVHECNGLRFMLSFSMARSLVQLEHLEITECQMMEEIVSTKQYGEEITGNMFPQLQHLKLKGLPNLAKFCSASYIEFPSLKRLQLSKCAKLETFISHPLTKNIATDNEIEEKYLLFDKKVVLPKLTSLMVHQCDGLRFLLSSSIAKILVELEHLKISKCQIMEKIVLTGDGVGNEGVLFSKLQQLELNDLPNLTRFCSGTYEIFNQYFLFDEKVSFPNLDKLIMDGLPTFRTIWHNQLPPDSFYRLKDVVVQECKSLINIFPHSVMGRLNDLSILYIRGCESLQVVFELVDIEVKNSYDRISAATQLKSLYCQNLDSVNIYRCGNLANIFLASVARDDQKFMPKINVDNYCGVLEEFVTKGEGIRTLIPKFVFPKLASDHDTFENRNTLVFSDHGQVEIFSAEYSSFQKILELGRLSTIKDSFRLINKVVLSNLTSLIVHQGDDLRFLLSSSMAKSLVQLKHLQVSKCEIMEEIILTRGDDKENMDNMFRKLENLDLNDLPCLARFCSGDYIRHINFPKVTSMTFRNLPQLTTFCSGMHASKWPLLKTLELYECYQVEIFAAQFSSFQILHQLGSLSTPTKQPFFLIEKGSFANLENLILDAMQIWYGPPGPADIFMKLKSIDFPFSKRAVFLQMGSSGHGDGSFPHVEKLRLNGMEKLRHLWKENPQPAGAVFPNLEILLLERCHSLENLRSSSFQNLTILEVTFCCRLRYLTSYSIAKSLVHLQKLKVDECKSMTEIVAIGDGDGDDEIVFSGLKHLEIYDLISLQRFCSPNCRVKMPSLITLTVEYCAVKFKKSQHDSYLLLDEEDASNFQPHDQAEVHPKAVNVNFNNEDIHLDVQSHSRNRHAVDTAAASSSGTNQNQPAQDEDAEFDARESRGEGFTTELNNDPALPDIPQSSKQGVEAVIQETPLFSKSLEQAEVKDLKEPVVTKNLQEADLGPIQHLNLITNQDKQFQLQAGSRSQRIAQIDAVMRRLQELRDKEAEMRDQEKQLADR